MKPDVNWKQVRVVAFDLFGTIFKLDRPVEEIRAYADHIRKPKWSPLELPAEWDRLEPFPDSFIGIQMLRDIPAEVVTLSNAPVDTQAALGCRLFHDVVPLEEYRVFKPDINAYVAACVHMDCLPRDVLLVTANEHFGDIEKSRQIGMQSILIDRAGKYPEMPHNTVQLAHLMTVGRRQ